MEQANCEMTGCDDLSSTSASDRIEWKYSLIACIDQVLYTSLRSFN